MTLISFLPFAAALSSLLLGVLSLLRRKRSFPRWCFFIGMTVLGIDSLLTGWIWRATELFDVLRGMTLGLIVKSFTPAIWLAFSLTFSRGDYRQSLARWRIPLAVLALLPIGLSLAFREQFFEVLPTGLDGAGAELHLGRAAKALNGIFLVAYAGILVNLEQTFRSAIGTMRWRVKFVVLGLAVIFGARLYVRSQALVFSAYDPRWSSVESGGLLIGCILLAVAYLRTGLAEVEVCPSRAVLRSSLTVLIVGAYLLIVGALANMVSRLGGEEKYQLAALAVLLGLAGLAVLLLSDRLRQRIHGFIARHFSRAQHDSVRIWTEFSRRLANVKDQAGLCTVSARLVSETLEALSVTVWMLDEKKEQFIVGASTAPQTGKRAGYVPAAASSAVVAGLRVRSSPFDLERMKEPWAEELRELNPRTFPTSGDRWCVPLRAGGQALGALVLADRVSGAEYTVEQLELLQCIADQVTSVLLNLRLTEEVARARELEAFRTMSAFFVHDLKNATASLNLMLKNLPMHLDDPEFREDAFRCVGNTTRRIDEMIGRLTALRQRPDIKPVEADLNQLVNEGLGSLDGMSNLELTTEFQSLPTVLVDREQIRSVVSNLALNARDALAGQGGRILVRTEHHGGRVVLSVVDNGCGMSAAFVKDSLFRPFQSTKKNGLGIGMFQSRLIVEAHGGSIQVESKPGKGSTFQVSLPVKEIE